MSTTSPGIPVSALGIFNSGQIFFVLWHAVSISFSLFVFSAHMDKSTYISIVSCWINFQHFNQILFCVVVNFSRQFWFVGHGVILLFVFAYMVEKFMFDLWWSKRYKILDIQCEQIVINLVHMTHGKNNRRRWSYQRRCCSRNSTCDDDYWRCFDEIPWILDAFSKSCSRILVLIWKSFLSYADIAIAGLRIVYHLKWHVDLTSILLHVPFVFSLVLSVSIPVKGDATNKVKTAVTLISFV